MADSVSNTSSQTKGSDDSEIKETEMNEESTGFDATESESPVILSDQSSSCASSEQNAQTDAASVANIIQSVEEPESKISDPSSSDCSASILTESSNLSTVDNAIVDETQISIDSSVSKVKHFTSSISPDQMDGKTSGVLKTGSDLDNADSVSQPGCGLSATAEEFQEILASLEESGSKNEGETSCVKIENPIEGMGDSSSEDETQNSEAVLLPGGSEEKKFTISLETITSIVVRKSMLKHDSSESSSSCSSLADACRRRRMFQRLHESVDSSSGTACTSMDSTSSESSLPEEAQKEMMRDRSDSYERAIATSRWSQYKKERKEKEKSDSDSEEIAGPAKRPALERKGNEDDDDPPTPGFPPIPPQERLI